MRQRMDSGRAALGYVVGVLGLVVAAVALTGVADAGNAPRRQARSTHIGIPPSDFVVLRIQDPDDLDDHYFARVSRDGTIAGTEYVVPAGRVLVVTEASHVGSGVAVALKLFLADRTAPTTRQPVFVGVTDDAGVYSMTTGFIVGPDSRLRAYIAPNNSLDNLSSSTVGDRTPDAAHERTTILVRGYLTTDE